MSEQASDNLQRAESDLSDLISQLKKGAAQYSDSYFNEVLFDESIEQWKIYREAKARSDSAGFAGGTLYAMVYSINLTNRLLSVN